MAAAEFFGTDDTLDLLAFGCGFWAVSLTSFVLVAFGCLAVIGDTAAMSGFGGFARGILPGLEPSPPLELLWFNEFSMLMAPSSPSNLSISDVFFFLGVADAITSDASLSLTMMTDAGSAFFVGLRAFFVVGPELMDEQKSFSFSPLFSHL